MGSAERHARIKDWNAWGLSWNMVSPPTRGTAAAHQFFKVWANTNFLMAYTIKLAATFTKVLENARVHKQKYPDAKMDPGEPSDPTPLDDFGRHRQLFCEMLYCRHVDNYQSYLTALLMEVFQQRPELLRSKRQVSVEMILDLPSREDLIRAVAETQVHDLSYEPFEKLRRYFDERGIFIASDEDASVIVEAIETRNIAVHNNCVINQRYLARVKCNQDRIGKTREIDVGALERLAILFGDLVGEIDARAAAKLKLPQHGFAIDPTFDEERTVRAP